MQAPVPSSLGPSTTADHVHAVDLDTSLDFVNTLEHSPAGPIEHLPSAAAAIEWIASHGLAHRAALEHDAHRQAALDEDASRQDEARYARILAVRAAIREAWDAEVERRPVGDGAVADLNRVLEGRLPPVFEAAGAGVRVTHRHGADAVGEALAELVGPVVDAIAGGEAQRFRVCANHACRWVFHDTSRTGRRRWCDMRICGNRAKVARHRARQRSGAGA